MITRLFSTMLCFMLLCTILLAAPVTVRADAGDVTLVSCTSGGTASTGTCQDPSISAGGRYVAFTATASNLAPGVTSNSIFRKDVASGEVTLCSCAPDGTSGNQASEYPSISADGTFVAFRSSSTNLIPGHPTNGNQQVFRKDLVTGEVMLCSSGPDGTQGNKTAGEPCISADGRFVVFASNSTNLLSSGATSSVQLFRKDLVTGETVLISCSPTGNQGNNTSDDVVVNSDSRYATFVSWATNLIPGNPTTGAQVFRKDLTTGEVMLVSSSASGAQGDQDSYDPDINTDGRYISFESISGNLVAGLTAGRKHVYRKDLQSQEVRLCSVNISGNEGNYDSASASISANGGYVSFRTQSTNLSPEAVNGQYHILRKSLAGGEVACCSISAAGQPGNQTSDSSDLSSDGKFVAFDSTATNLIDGQPTSGKQVFRKELAYNTFFYFAEGYTGEGFQEYLCLGNPGEAGIDVAVTYVFADSDPVTETLPVPAGSRVTVDVNAEVGAGRDVSIRTASTDPFVAERPIYFRYGPGWTGGHDVVGASSPDTSWYFAEGYTGPGFDEWVCVLNPGQEDAELVFRFQTQEVGEVVRTGYTVEAGSRATFKVNEVLGEGYSTSLYLQSDQPVVAERPVYFDYTGTGNYAWTGGHCVMGTTYLKREYYFAEGYTGDGVRGMADPAEPLPAGGHGQRRLPVRRRRRAFGTGLRGGRRAPAGPSSSRKRWARDGTSRSN